jgi:hypothetical protein
MAVKAGGMFRLVKLNSDNERSASQALEVKALPTGEICSAYKITNVSASFHALLSYLS